MNVSAKEGVVLDVCEEHGIWLDAGEMEEIQLKVALRKHKTQRSAVKRARKDGKLDGIMFGWFSLMSS
jgi:Zn-finger nucleic acid-binding protein